MTDEQYKHPPEALQALLGLHRAWVESEGREGVQLTDESARWKLTGVRLDGVCFRQAKLHLIDFESCSLVGADFAGASLDSSRFLNCDLKGVKFDEADLSGCTFVGNANVRPESFKTANLYLADIPNITPPRSREDIAAWVLSGPPGP